MHTHIHKIIKTDANVSLTNGEHKYTYKSDIKKLLRAAGLSRAVDPEHNLSSIDSIHARAIIGRKRGLAGIGTKLVGVKLLNTLQQVSKLTSTN